MTQRERIVEFLRSQMWSASEWREDEDSVVAVVGRARVVEPDDDEGLYSDDEGELTVSVAGAPKYGNERAWVGFRNEEYHDDPLEVRDPSTLELL